MVWVLEEKLVLEGVRLNFAHHVEDGAVARLKHGDNLVLKLNRIGAAHNAVSLLLERFNGNVRNARIVEALDEVGTQRVDRKRNP